MLTAKESRVGKPSCAMNRNANVGADSSSVMGERRKSTNPDDVPCTRRGAKLAKG